MPKGDHIGRKRVTKPTPLLEVDATPSELGRYLRDKCDLVIVGQTHLFSGADDARAAISGELSLKQTFWEGSPSEKGILNDRRTKITDNWGKAGDQVRDLILERGGTIIPVDIEHKENAESIRNLIKVAGVVGGVEMQFDTAFNYVAGEAGEHGRNVFRHMQETPSQGGMTAVRKLVEDVLSHDGDVISKENQKNLLRALEELEFSERTDVWASVQRIGRSLARDKMEYSPVWFETRNVAMADGIDSVMRVPEEGTQKVASTFQVGSGHNERVEDILEARGYRVANVKVVVVRNPDLDNKVYWNPDPLRKDDAEWVVTAYDRDAPPLTEYSMPGNQRCQKPTEIPKAKIVLEGVEK